MMVVSDTSPISNLRTIGLLGVLLEAKAQGHLPAVQPIMDQLRQEAKFFGSLTILANPNPHKGSKPL